MRFCKLRVYLMPLLAFNICELLWMRLYFRVIYLLSVNESLFSVWFNLYLWVRLYFLCHSTNICDGIYIFCVISPITVNASIFSVSFNKHLWMRLYYLFYLTIICESIYIICVISPLPVSASIFSVPINQILNYKYLNLLKSREIL